MANRKAELEDHIATLEDFEARYGEFLVERRGGDHDWSGEEWARRERELKELAPQAEGAMVAAGRGTRWDEGPVRIGLPARILRFVDEGDGIDDTEQWEILEEIPTAIGALKGKLKRATGVPEMGLKDSSAQIENLPPWPAPAARNQPVQPSWWREPNPWVLGFVVTVFGGLVVLAVWAIIAA